MTPRHERSLFILGLRLWFFMAMISTVGAISFLTLIVIVTNPVLLTLSIIGLIYAHKKGHLKAFFGWICKTRVNIRCKPVNSDAP